VVHKIPAAYKRAIVARVKIISNLDISEHRKPQSGKIFIRYQGKELEYRVETTPTVGGQEDAVLRILTAAEPLPLENMAFSDSDLQAFKESLSKPYGIILSAPQAPGKPRLSIRHCGTSIPRSVKYGRRKTRWRSRKGVSDKFKFIQKLGSPSRKRSVPFCEPIPMSS
jgi:hypothetical protein